MSHTRTLAALAAAALLAPAAPAVAKPEKLAPVKSERAAKAKKVKKVKKVKTVMYVFKGVVNADGSVKVAKGNSFVKKAGLYGKDVTFDFTGAKLVVADADANGVTIEDVKAGDKVLVQSRAPRKVAADHQFVARKLVDQTRPPVEDAEDKVAAPAPTPAP